MMDEERKDMQTVQERIWGEKGKDLMNGIEDLMWNEEDGTWYDFDISRNRPRLLYI